MLDHLLLNDLEYSRYRICINGLVQGVGMRPYVCRLARKLDLKGSVYNDNSGIVIDAFGRKKQLDSLIQILTEAPPAHTQIDQISVEELNWDDSNTPSAFTIEKSVAYNRDDVSHSPARKVTKVPQDLATCEICLREIMDKENHRFRYPFTSCTQCGPRFSILKSMPFDRQHTSMVEFKLCAACEAEYRNPDDRRYHSQTNACSECGPKLRVLNRKAEAVSLVGNDEIGFVADKIKAGKIVAIKGLGGYHLACDASNDQAVAFLRKQKNRMSKPFALMAKDLEQISLFAEMDHQQCLLLKSAQAPIVLLPKRMDTEDSKMLSPLLAPNQNRLGFMLPYTPLHFLLMQELNCPIVLTSANKHGEPQYTDDALALQGLNKIADYFLMNNRKIVNRVDDALALMEKPLNPHTNQIQSKSDTNFQMLRLGRGYAPLQIELPQDMFDRNILAMGADLKAHFCFAQAGNLVQSQYMGDLESFEVYREYQKQLTRYRELYGFNADAIAIDMHPNYLSSKLGRQFAEREGLTLIEVQHHHAHIAACMLENKVNSFEQKVLGIALDGLGYGDNGTFWGGEFFVADYQSYKRVAHLQAHPMPGGAQCVREPWRNTISYLSNLFENDESQFEEIVFACDALKEKPVAVLKTILKQKINSPLASSAGRLFDAVAGLLNICPERIAYEGEAAICLQQCAEKCFYQEVDKSYTFSYVQNVLSWDCTWRAILRDLKLGVEVERIAARFHHAFINAIIHVGQTCIQEAGLSTFALGGGVFQNTLVYSHVKSGLEQKGYTVLIPSNLPLNDGGIAPGQVAIAAAKLQSGIV